MPLLAGPFREIDGRQTMRSLADALAKLREAGGLCDGEDATVKTLAVGLPNGGCTGVVSVVGPSRPAPPQWLF
jgi:hypothetical protein